tara:strand:- start:250 stop:354 length:105 start_codon:yes stop_codon:yes gene_type:complete
MTVRCVLMALVVVLVDQVFQVDQTVRAVLVLANV